MSIISPEPIFCVVLGDAEHWSVEAEWPDGTVEEPAGPFASDSEARDWITHKSQAWLDNKEA